MSTLQALLNSAFAYRLGITLLHSLWQGGVVLAALWAAMRMLRHTSSQSRYLISVLAMSLLVALPLATFFTVSAPAQPATFSQAGGAAPVTEVSAPPAGVPTGNAVNALQTQLSIDATRLVAPVKISSSGYEIALPYIVTTWFIGVMLLALWNFGGWVALQQLRFSTTQPAGDAADRLMKTLATRLRVTRSIRILQSTLARTPMVIGALKPVILLPASALTELSISELESIIAHELAHIRRHDFVINLLQAVIETVLFYHPAVWLISARVRQERENCCDDLALSVTRDRASYVRALAAVANVRVSTLVPAASGGKLLPRLQRLLGISDSSAGRFSPWSATTVLLMVLVALLAFTSTNARADDADVITVHGHVVDPAGKPVSGATISAVTPWGLDTPLSTAQSKAFGEFEISFRKSQLAETNDQWQLVSVAATLKGFGPGWVRVDHVPDNGDAVLHLVPDDVPIEGRIVSLEGNPVSGVTVKLAGIQSSAADLNKLEINGDDPTLNPADAFSRVGGTILGDVQSTVTSADGKFRFTGIGNNRNAEMSVAGAGITHAAIQANTKPGPTQNRGFQDYIKVQRTVFGPTFDYVASPGLKVRGTVRDAVTHQPIAGVKLMTNIWRGEATTDADGRYEVQGLKRDNPGRIVAQPRDDQAYIRRSLPVNVIAGDASVALDFELHPGVILHGKITDKVTGAPVSMASVDYFPYLTNDAAKQLPEFTRELDMNAIGRCTSHADGSFTVVVTPGPGVIAALFGRGAYCHGEGADTLKVPRTEGGMKAFGAIWRRPEHFNSVAEIDVPVGNQSAMVELKYNPGRAVHVTLVDSKGEPVSGAIVEGHSPVDIGFEHVKASAFDIVALGDKDDRYIKILHTGRQIGRVLKISASDAKSGDLKLTLEPWSYATGRMVDKDGLPVVGAMVQGSFLGFLPAHTDKDGRFKLTLVPGLPCSVNGIKNRTEFATDVHEIQLSPGVTKDFGDVHAKMFN